MVIYIKLNEIITESEYTEEQIENLQDNGFQAVTVPNVSVPSDYKYSDFEFVNNSWRLKNE
jgi:hypothetical protein